MERRAGDFRHDRPAVPLSGRTVIVVDDGIATGATARAALDVARAHGARRVILAVPVAPPETLRELQPFADEVVCLASPAGFHAVGQWYDDFTQTTDADVIQLLARHTLRCARTWILGSATFGRRMGTDPEIRDEVIDTVRRWVARDVIPFASELEHADEYPDAMVEQMKELGLFGITIPEEYGGLGLDLLTYIGVIEELSYGWMSLSGVVNTHTMCAHEHPPLRHRRPEATVAARSRRGREARRPLALRARRRHRHPQHLVPRHARRRRVDRQRHQDLGHQRRTCSIDRCWRRAPTKASARSSSRRSPGPRHGGITVSKNISKLGYKGLETVEMSYADHRMPADALIGDLGRGLPQILSVMEVGRINIAARAVGVARAAFDARASRTRSSA